jgi:hypothetical protein
VIITQTNVIDKPIRTVNEKLKCWKLIVPIKFEHKARWNKIIGKMLTLFRLISKGDFTSNWHHSVVSELELLRSLKVVCLISFFTPRGPVYSGRFICKQLTIPWIVDFQDPYYEGYSNWLSRYFIRVWTMHFIKRATHVTCVDPRWSIEISNQLKKDCLTLRHAVPDLGQIYFAKKCKSKPHKLFYSGSIDFTLQSIDIFCDVVSEVSKEYDLEFGYAGNKDIHEKFKDKFKDNHVKYVYCGWLTKEDLYEQIDKSDIVVVFPWISPSRIGVPSKLYEYCSFDTPILIAGNDSGGISDLFMELNVADAIARTHSEVKEAIRGKFDTNDTSRLFEAKKVISKMMSEDQLVNSFIELIP